MAVNKGHSSLHTPEKVHLDKLGTKFSFIEGLVTPCGMAINKAGQVIVAEERKNVVSILTPTGEKVRTLDSSDTSVGTMSYPHSVAVDSEDNVLVADTKNHRLVKFSPKGDVIGAFGCRGSASEQFKTVLNLCVSGVTGHVYVVDYDAHCVVILDSDLSFSSKFGCKGDGDGQFNHPFDVACDSNGFVYVTDSENDRVQVFTPEGDYLRQFGNKSRSYNRRLITPSYIAIDDNDRVFVVENGTYRVSVRTCEGAFLKIFAVSGFFIPYCGMAVSQCGGVVFLSDRNNNRLYMYH